MSIPIAKENPWKVGSWTIQGFLQPGKNSKNLLRDPHESREWIIMANYER